MLFSMTEAKPKPKLCKYENGIKSMGYFVELKV